MKLEYEIRGNLLIIHRYPLHLYYEIKKAFTFNLIGYDRKEQKRTTACEVVATGYDVSGKDIDLSCDWESGFQPPKMLVTFHGYESDLILIANRHRMKISRTVTELTDPAVYIPQWHKIPDNFEFRYMQREIIELVGKSQGGIIIAPVGIGKSELMGVMPCIYPDARMLICSYRKQVYSEIAGRIKKYVLPGVKYFIQGNKPITQYEVQQSRIVVCGSKSLPRILGCGDNYDFVIIDEAHQACAPDTFNIISSLVKPKIYGLTGSFNRSDSAQFRLKGLCGPILLEVDMRKAVEKGLVVPIRVLWCPVNLQYDPTANCHVAYKKHKGIWHNVVRNKLIAGAAKSHDENTQVLIMVETVKHAIALKALLPEYLVVSSETINLDRIRGAFKKGSIKKIIATGTWREGVDFPQLGVLINATGTKSEIANIQLTGRVSRLGENKTCGIVYDFFDHWNSEFKYFSNLRKKLYDRQGFMQSEIQPTELLANIK